MNVEVTQKNVLFTLMQEGSECQPGRTGLL